MEKFTKRNIYTALINFVDNGMMTFITDEGEVEIPMDRIKAFAEKEITLLDNKAAKAKETAARKKTEADELMKVLEGVLTDEFETIANIAAKIEDEDVTVAKCTYRLNKLVEMGVAEKTDIKIAGTDGKKGRTVKGYRLADVEQCTKDDVE